MIATSSVSLSRVDVRTVGRVLKSRRHDGQPGRSHTPKLGVRA